MISSAPEVDSLFGLVDRLYRGLIRDDAILMDVLASLARIFQADHCVLVIQRHGQESPLLRYVYPPQPDGGLLRNHDQYYRRRNPLLRLLARPSRAGRSVIWQGRGRSDACWPADFYNAFMPQLGWGSVLAGSFHAEADRIGYLLLGRRDGVEPLAPAAAAALDRLLPQIAAASSLRDSFSHAIASMERALFQGSQPDIGMAYFNAAGEPVLINDPLRHIFAAADGLGLAGNQIVGGGWHETLRIRALVEDTLRQSSESEDLPKGNGMDVARPSGRKPYRVDALRVRGRERFIEDNDIVVVLRVVDPETVADPTADFARYRLTPAEIRVARSLMAGLRPKEIATQTGLSLNTIRVQQRSLYRKLGVSRHFELMRLLVPGWAGTGET